MNTYKFNFVVNAWISDVTIEANSVEEAHKILIDTSLPDMLGTAEGYVKDFNISDIDCEVTYDEIVTDVKVTDIEYVDSDVEGPTELNVQVDIPSYMEEEEEIRTLIANEIESEVGEEVESFKYEII